MDEAGDSGVIGVIGIGDLGESISDFGVNSGSILRESELPLNLSDLFPEADLLRRPFKLVDDGVVVKLNRGEFGVVGVAKP